MSEQLAGQRIGSTGSDRDLEAVLARVSGTAHDALAPSQIYLRDLHEPERRRLGRKVGEHAAGGRSLQREQCPIIENFDRAAVADVVAQMFDVILLACGVDDDQEMFAKPADHEVIAHAAGVVRQQGIALPAIRQINDIGRCQRLQRCGSAGAFNPHLAHVRDVEEARAPRAYACARG